MKWISFLCVLFMAQVIFVIDVSSNQNDAVFLELIKPYFEMIESNSESEIESYFTDDFNLKFKKYFKERCGVPCELGLSTKWELEYTKYLSTLNASRRNFNVVNYDLNIKANMISLILLKKSCLNESAQENLVYLKYGTEWKIDRVKFSSWSDDMINKYGKIERFKLKRNCKN